MKLVIVSGPSGSGKSTIVKEFVEKYSTEYEMVKSVTSRKPRKNQEENQYIYVSEKEFKRLAEENRFLETNMYIGNGSLYGTPKADVQRVVGLNKIPILEIDVNGKKQIEKIKDEFGFEVISIFVVASPEVLYERLLKRGEPLDSIVQRLSVSCREILVSKEYDAVIINDKIENSIKQLHDILSGERKSKNLQVDEYCEEMHLLIRKIQSIVEV